MHMCSKAVIAPETEPGSGSVAHKRCKYIDFKGKTNKLHKIYAEKCVILHQQKQTGHIYSLACA